MVWLRIGLLAFGGPAAHVALIHSEICDRLKWAKERDFVQGFSFVTLLPGPEAMQLGVYLGWCYGGVRSAIVAGLGFVIPGAVLMIALTVLFASWRGIGLIEGVFSGMQPVIVAFVILAAWRITRQTVTSVIAAVIAIASFTAFHAFDVSFVWIALAAAAWAPLVLRVEADAADTDGDPAGGPAPSLRRSLLILAAGAAVLLAVVGAAWATGVPVYREIAVHITTAVLVVLGGAYAVIGYVADQAVGPLAWMLPEQVVDGLALAEAAPGPLILFNTYAGALAASKLGTAHAIAGGVLATVVTFAPSFALVLAGAPFVSRLHRNVILRRALAGVSAAVIGLIVSLAVLLTDTVLWTERGINLETVMVALFALIILGKRMLAAHWLMVLGAAVGLARWAFFGV